MGGGSLRVGTPRCQATTPQSKTTAVAIASLNRYVSSTGAKRSMRVRLGSVDEGFDTSWLTADEREFLQTASTSPEASILKIDSTGITVVGKSAMGMLYGVQTINQLLLQATREKRDTIPHLVIRDWPDLRWRCLAPTLTWYSGWNRLEGYDICNWSEGEWKWLADWSLLHKCNAWAVCMYGYWPFDLPGYENETLNVESDWFNPQTRQKEKHRFVQACVQGDDWKTAFRQTVHRRQKGVVACEVPLLALPSGQPLRVRFITDSYTRAMDRTSPTWKWAVWHRPRLFRAGGGGAVIYDFAERLADARLMVQLDADGKLRAFDHAGEDSTGATFRLVNGLKPEIAAFTPHKDGKLGVTVAEYTVMVG